MLGTEPRWVLVTTLIAVLAGCSGDQLLGPEGSPGLTRVTSMVSAASVNSGSIAIVLDMQPNRPTNIPFEAKGPKLRSFVLDDDVTSTLPGSRTFTRLKAGSYTVKLGTLAGLTLLDLTCESSGTENNTIDEASRSVTISLEAGESVTCTFVGHVPIWNNGDLTTYSQTSWNINGDGGELLSPSFFDVYTSGIMEIGLPGAAGFSIRFTDPFSIFEYLPAAGTPAPLTADLIDPTSTMSGSFGGEVLVLTLNIDFSDADLLPASSETAFGDLTLCNMSAIATLNGLSVRSFSGLVNTLLGGGSNGYTITDVFGTLELLTISFEGGSASQFAQDHLVSGVCP